VNSSCIEALKRLLPWLPEKLPAAVVVARHLPHVNDYRSVLPNILAQHARLPAQWIRSGQTLDTGRIFVAPQRACTSLRIV
jgi:two-component system, chemotaxis family, protein-glutamate methylesterase/glutaminase